MSFLCDCRDTIREYLRSLERAELVLLQFGVSIVVATGAAALDWIARESILGE